MSDRAQRLVGLMLEQGIDLLLITALVNVRYMTGYTGSNGLAVVGPEQRDLGTTDEGGHAAFGLQPLVRADRGPLGHGIPIRTGVGTGW